MWKQNVHVSQMEFAREKCDHEKVHPPGNMWKSWKDFADTQVTELRLQSNSLDSKLQRAPYLYLVCR